MKLYIAMAFHFKTMLENGVGSIHSVTFLCSWEEENKQGFL